MRVWLRALVWLVVAAGLLLAGFAVFGAAVLAPGVMARGELPGPVQREALATVYEVLSLQALVPELLLVFATWLVVARFAPALDRSRWALLLGLFGVGALWFPTVGHFSFEVWTPTKPADYVNTLLLVAGGAAGALWLARVVSPALAPGCFTSRAKSGMVDAP